MFCSLGRSCDYMILTDRRTFVYKLPPKFVRCSRGLHIFMSHQIKWHQVKCPVTSRQGSGIFTAPYFIMGLGGDIFISIYQLLLKVFLFLFCVAFLFVCFIWCGSFTCTAAKKNQREPPSSFPYPLVPESQPCSWAGSTNTISLKYIFLPMQLFSLTLTNINLFTLRA